ncbi:MAG: transglutaminaseTgpA domain-containing protein [Caryophanon sp.]|nr:transglutaminaseTgpA domain-containing protein [Caryophanon sp.]
MKAPISKVELAVYYTLIFLILYEWLVPVMELTNTGYIHYFMLFIVLSIICVLLKLRSWFSAVIKVVYILWFITLTHGGMHLVQLDGMRFLLSEVTYNAQQLLAGDFSYITNSIRTILFFVLLWMLMYLIHYWMTVRYSLFYFLVMTIFFIAALDTFSTYDGKFAIIKVLLYGLVLTGMLVLKQIITAHDIRLSWKQAVLYTLPLVVVVAAAGYGAYSLPKSPPKWPDPVPFVTGVITGEKTVSQVGYDTNDAELGGSFESDDTLVFTAQTNEKRYWRIDSRDTYTSKGWEQSYDEPTKEYITPNTLIGTMRDEDQVDYVTITMDKDDSYVLSPYGTLRYDYEDGYMIEESVESGYRESVNVTSWTEEMMPSYSIEVDEPTYSLEELRNTDMSRYAQLGEEFERYLQLPETLPQRVRDLAVSVTEKAPNAYDKARAIETYFQSSGFTYTTKGVAVPDDDEDYVDQFLFETKYGYCDNFSTAMVVMLRALDIPARWVKGFVTGDAIDSTTYEITNNEAHSWVEVYLVGIGWVPFEPTIGFTGSLDISYDVQEQEVEAAEQKPEEAPQTPEQLSEEEQDAALAPTSTFSFAEVWDVLKWLFGGIAFLLLVVSFIMYKRRRQWLPSYYIKQSKNEPQNWTTFEKNYKNLLRQLHAVGYVRGSNETLSAYAKKIDEALQCTEMTTLTTIYECYLYGNSTQDVDFAYLQECWEYLINRTSG